MEVGGGSRESGRVYLWLIRIRVWQKPTQYCNYTSVYNKFFFKKNKDEKKVHIKKIFKKTSELYHKIRLGKENNTLAT